MSNTFADLKKTRKSLFDKLKEEANKVGNSGGKTSDNRFWQPTLDKAGNGFAVIRFLPSPNGEDLPWVKLFTHGFNGPGGWYIENSLTTIGKPDPVGEMNSVLWNRGDEAGKEQARKQKRKLGFISNIYIVSDPANRSNEGKVFLYRYGKKIYDKISYAMHPPEEFKDETSFNPFDLWEGANFKLKIRKVEGYNNYELSSFESITPLSKNDSELEKIYGCVFSLKEFIDLKEFKPYEILKAKLNRVLGSAAVSTTAEEHDEEIPPPRARSSSAVAPKGIESQPWEESSDDSLEFFKKLAEDD